MIKTLITTISHMESLPSGFSSIVFYVFLICSSESRFGNFKLFFNESTPDDYQPLHFRAAEVDNHKWFFTTHDADEVPERMSIGKLQTGWHG